MEAAWTQARRPARGRSGWVTKAFVAPGMCFLLGDAWKLGLPESWHSCAR